MKFFTPKLLVRYGSTNDATADAAQREWEEADQAYRKHLDRIRPKLPRGVRILLGKFCLHDARLVTLGMREDNRKLALVLELDAPHGMGLLMSYDLTKRPRLIRHPELSEPGTPLEWLYDEMDVARGGAHPTFTRSILFTGGRELVLTLRRLRLTPLEKILAPATNGEETNLDALLAG